jgi:hypothetical protein
MRTIKRILRIHNIEGYKIYCLFNNGESRIIDFKFLFDKWQTNEKSFEYPLKQSLAAFQQVELVDGTLVWKNIIIESLDEEDKPIIYYFDLDPIVLYELSQIDTSRQIDIGLMIKQTRKDMGMTQAELAKKIGSSKHYISRIENNKSGIE